MAVAPDAKGLSNKFRSSAQSATGWLPGPGQQSVARPEKRCLQERPRSLPPWQPCWSIQSYNSDEYACRKSCPAIVGLAYRGAADRAWTSGYIRSTDARQYQPQDRAVAESNAKLPNGWSRSPLRFLSRLRRPWRGQ